jgi:predicted TIM-barrel fold metal-dependent hydrolase
MRDYRLISADSHVVEPPDLWTSRLPAKFKERAPRMVRLDKGDAWLIEGLAQPFPFGLNLCGGLPPEKYTPWVRWEEVRPEAVEPVARLRALDACGCDAEVLYPTPRIQNALALQEEDPAFQIACVRAYNDYLAEYCAADPERLAGVAMLPTVGVESAVSELERVRQLPGIRSVVVSRYPQAQTRLSPEDDALWARCVEAGMPVSVHVGLSGSPSGTPELALSFTGAFHGAFRFYDPPVRIAEMIYTRLFDRFPALRVVMAEVDVGWLPYLKEQLDDRYGRQNPAEKATFALKPSEYTERNLFYTIVKDRYGIRNRHAVGVGQILWSSDFPHATCDYPDYHGAIARDFAGVPPDELHAMLAGTAQRLYFADGAAR